MQAEQLYKELVDYIYENAGEFKTPAERMAGKFILYNGKGMSDRMLSMVKHKGWFDDTEEIRAMVADGYDVFKKRVAERIYREHKNELKLNLCPQCGKIARTPLARQCRFCFHQWHQKV